MLKCTFVCICLRLTHKIFFRKLTFVDHLCYLCLLFVMLSCLFIAALWSPEGKGLTYWLLFVMFIVILFLSHLVSWDIISIPDPCCLSHLDIYTRAIVTKTVFLTLLHVQYVLCLILNIFFENIYMYNYFFLMSCY